MSGCKILKKKEPLRENFYICSEHFEEDCFEIDLIEGKCDYVFSLCCNSNSHLKTFFKNISQFSIKILDLHQLTIFPFSTHWIQGLK